MFYAITQKKKTKFHLQLMIVLKQVQMMSVVSLEKCNKHVSRVQSNVLIDLRVSAMTLLYFCVSKILLNVQQNIISKFIYKRNSASSIGQPRYVHNNSLSY